MKVIQSMIDEISECISLGYINKTKHPKYDLWVYNYSKSAQYDWVFDKYEATKLCRGLIVDDNFNIIARAYPKFFSYEQIEDKSEIPMDESCRIYDKVDGSMGVIYQVPNGDDGDTAFVATRGSFISEMAEFANKLMYSKYSEINWDPKYSYVVEIIYPENRIVVDYGDKRELVLHGIYDNDTGEDIPLNEFEQLGELRAAGLTIVDEYDMGDKFEGFDKLLEKHPYDGQEGFVVRFESGYRVKIKYDEYKKLSYLKDIVTAKKLLVMIEEKSIDDLKDQIPTEILERIEKFEKEISYTYNLIKDVHIMEWDFIMSDLIDKFDNPTKKQIAEVIMSKKNTDVSTGLLFALSAGDTNKVNKIIWNIVKEELKGFVV